MPKALWRTRAIDELEDIVVYIGAHEGRPETALKIAEEIKAKATEYASHPQIGKKHASFREEWLYFVHKRWIVVYREHPDGKYENVVSVTMTRYWHGAAVAIFSSNDLRKPGIGGPDQKRLSMP